MNRNTLWFCVAISLCSGMPLCAQQSTSEKVADKAKKDYRIEVEKDQNDVPQKIRFVSSDRKTIKTLSADRAMVSKNGRSLIWQDSTKTEPGSDYEEYERSFMDASGKVRWKKKWKNHPRYGVNPEDGFSGWFEGIADNGERSFVTYRDTDDMYYLVVLNEAGKEIAKATNRELLFDIEISPDGKLVGAKTEIVLDERAAMHLFFLDVDTGRTKLLKAEGEGWSAGFVLTSSPTPPINGKVRLYWSSDRVGINGRKRGYKDIAFSGIPGNLSDLFYK